MERELYVTKLEEMINDGVKKGKYVELEGTTLKDLTSFQSFLTRNYKNTLSLDNVKWTKKT